MGKIIDGKKVSKTVLKNVEKEVQSLKKKKISPGLAIIQVGENPASNIYVKKKLKKAKSLGFNIWHINLPTSVSFEKIKRRIQALNKHKRVNGMIVQMHLPKNLDPWAVMALITSEKAVDGFSYENQGRLFAGNPLFVPATPKGILTLIKSTKKPIQGKNCVVIGRSNIVGKPVSQLLLAENATVTVCHSKTKNLKFHTKNADILIAAVGVAKFVKASMVKKGAIVIDVGINKVGEKLFGDVDFEKTKKIASFITPVPGGVGPMTIASLLENTVVACKRQHNVK